MMKRSKAMRLSFLPVLLFLLVFCACAGASEFEFVNVRDTDSLAKGFATAEKSIAQNPTDPKVYLRGGIAAHQLALLAGKGYAEKAVRYLEAYVAREPRDAVAIAYLGSAYAMQARDSSAIMKRLTNANKGIDLLNQAVAGAPDNFIVRMVRGSVFYELPGMFNYSKEAFEDFSFVAGRFADEPLADAELKAEVYYKLGRLALKRGDKDASGYFAKAVQAAPESHWSALARKE